jgi:two-component system cell cycle response regulator DivK
MSRRRSPGRRPARRSPAGVLIVDDTADVREMYGEYFTARGFRVTTAHDGEAGIATATHHPPDVIVMDLSMPRIGGITAIRRLKADARTRYVPVILLTGYPYKAIEEGALEAGADVFMTKPCLPEDLEHQVQRLLARGGSRTAA